MKKGLLLLVLAGTFLVSCGGGQEKEAAEAFCDCYAESAEAIEAAGEVTASSLFESVEKMKEIDAKAQECRKGWDEKYNGKIDLAIFEEEVKKTNESVYKLAVDNGVFKK
ncbi:MAG: hypothetical protein HRT57_17855 [Crocinitomicaceae bacterium]|nr:hypothetical protein [Crocinitomicaceae bacterium]